MTSAQGIQMDFLPCAARRAGTTPRGRQKSAQRAFLSSVRLIRWSSSAWVGHRPAVVARVLELLLTSGLGPGFLSRRLAGYGPGRPAGRRLK